MAGKRILFLYKENKKLKMQVKKLERMVAIRDAHARISLRVLGTTEEALNEMGEKLTSLRHEVKVLINERNGR